MYVACVEVQHAPVKTKEVSLNLSGYYQDRRCGCCQRDEPSTPQHKCVYNAQVPRPHAEARCGRQTLGPEQRPCPLGAQVHDVTNCGAHLTLGVPLEAGM